MACKRRIVSDDDHESRPFARDHMSHGNVCSCCYGAGEHDQRKMGRIWSSTISAVYALDRDPGGYELEVGDLSPGDKGISIAPSSINGIVGVLMGV